MSSITMTVCLTFHPFIPPSYHLGGSVGDKSPLAIDWWLEFSCMKWDALWWGWHVISFDAQLSWKHIAYMKGLLILMMFFFQSLASHTHNGKLLIKQWHCSKKRWASKDIEDRAVWCRNSEVLRTIRRKVSTEAARQICEPLGIKLIATNIFIFSYLLIEETIKQKLFKAIKHSWCWRKLEASSSYKLVQPPLAALTSSTYVW